METYPCGFFLGGALCDLAYGTLVPQLGIRLMPPTVEAWSLNHWTTREVPETDPY